MSKSRRRSQASSRPSAETTLRIIGGNLRASRLVYHGDPRTRPMKERIREATLNLIGPSIKGTYALDLFAGTGALALEAISRGAVGATAIERHFPTADLIEENSARLGVGDRIEVVRGDTFVWIQQFPTDLPKPWTVFCSPPYRFYEERRDEMLELIGRVCDLAPEESIIVVESEVEWDVEALPDLDRWDVRAYRPARLALRRI